MFNSHVPKPVVLCMLRKPIDTELSCQLYTMHRFTQIVSRPLWTSLQQPKLLYDSFWMVILHNLQDTMDANNYRTVSKQPAIPITITML